MAKVIRHTASVLVAAMTVNMAAACAYAEGVAEIAESGDVTAMTYAVPAALAAGTFLIKKYIKK